MGVKLGLDIRPLILLFPWVFLNGMPGWKASAVHLTLLKAHFALEKKLLIASELLVETHLKPRHADVNLGHLEAVKHTKKENSGYKESYLLT